MKRQSSVQKLEWKEAKKILVPFRKQQWAAHSPWLLELFPHAEDSLDESADHFVTINRGECRAAVRLSTEPNEVSDLFPELMRALPLDHKFGEISRLVSTGSFKERAVCVSNLLIEAGYDYHDNGKGSGLLGICRPEKLPFFKRFGFTSLFPHPLHCNSRNRTYCVISATWEAMKLNLQKRELHHEL